MARFLAIAILLLPAALAAQEQEQYFQDEEKPHFTFQWDFLARYDSIYHLRVRPDIERGRFEVRPEIGFKFNDRLRVAVRALGSYGTDENTQNLRNFDNYRSRTAMVERWYVELKPGPVTVLGGAFGMPLVASEMLWDRDIQTTGGAASWEIPAGASQFTVAAAGFLGPQRDGDKTRILAGQAVWRWGDPMVFSVEAAGAYWHYDFRDLAPAYLRQNYTKLVQGKLVYLSDYHLLDGVLRARFPLGPIPVTIAFDAIHNFGTPTDDADAFEATVALGRLGSPGQVRGFYTFQYIERDALPGAYNTDDWWFHTWAVGHRVGIGITVWRSVYVQSAVVFQRRLDRNTWLNRVTVDLVKMF